MSSVSDMKLIRTDFFSFSFEILFRVPKGTPTGEQVLQYFDFVSLTKDTNLLTFYIRWITLKREEIQI